MSLAKNLWGRVGVKDNFSGEWRCQIFLKHFFQIRKNYERSKNFSEKYHFWLKNQNFLKNCHFLPNFCEFLISGSRLKSSLKDDPVNPVLLDEHFEAVDRRVNIVLKVKLDVT
jgi:hypothetical protein